MAERVDQDGGHPNPILPTAAPTGPPVLDSMVTAALDSAEGNPVTLADGITSGVIVPQNDPVPLPDPLAGTGNALIPVQDSGPGSHAFFIPAWGGSSHGLRPLLLPVGGERSDPEYHPSVWRAGTGRLVTLRDIVRVVDWPFGMTPSGDYQRGAYFPPPLFFPALEGSGIDFPDFDRTDPFFRVEGSSVEGFSYALYYPIGAADMGDVRMVLMPVHACVRNPESSVPDEEAVDEVLDVVDDCFICPPHGGVEMQFLP